MSYLNVSAQRLSNYSLERLDEKNGLSNNWITHSALDSNGFLWIAINDGLNRLDRHSFIVLNMMTACM
jgi:ligand-binding sensor domain-containing protein